MFIRAPNAKTGTGFTANVNDAFRQGQKAAFKHQFDLYEDAIKADTAAEDYYNKLITNTLNNQQNYDKTVKSDLDTEVHFAEQGGKLSDARIKSNVSRAAEQGFKPEDYEKAGDGMKRSIVANAVNGETLANQKVEDGATNIALKIAQRDQTNAQSAYTVAGANKINQETGQNKIMFDRQEGHRNLLEENNLLVTKEGQKIALEEYINGLWVKAEAEAKKNGEVLDKEKFFAEKRADAGVQREVSADINRRLTLNQTKIDAYNKSQADYAKHKSNKQDNPVTLSTTKLIDADNEFLKTIAKFPIYKYGENIYHVDKETGKLYQRTSTGVYEVKINNGDLNKIFPDMQPYTPTPQDTGLSKRAGETTTKTPTPSTGTNAQNLNFGVQSAPGVVVDKDGKTHNVVIYPNGVSFVQPKA